MGGKKLMLTYLAVDVLFAMSGGLIMGFTVINEQKMRETPSQSTIAQHVLLNQCPLTAGIVNGILIFLTFLVSLPAFFLPQSRNWLRIHGWLVLACAIFTLGLGLAIWVETLQTRRHLGSIWGREAQSTQSLLQQKFNCCGYFNAITPPFVQDAVCTDPLVAAQRGGCLAPFSSFANGYLDVIFTALFGIVGLDFVLILCVAMVIRYRQEEERYRHIDEKTGVRNL